VHHLQLLMKMNTNKQYPDIPNTKDGFLYNIIGDELNSLGHRCKEIKEVLGEDLQFPRYFLVLGDNACLHMHKPLEETWPYLLSKTINHQYYNLAVSDTGLEGIKYNLFNWLFLYGNPKMIFISCEWANRFIGVDYDQTEGVFKDVNRASELADTSGYFVGKRRLFTKLLEQIDIPIYLILGPNDEPVAVSDIINTLELDHSDDANVAEIVSEGFLEAQRGMFC
jgi:hypothetical protein|tara:strand:- start:1007 stop:1678 length:672 start_codon:yes stop_codon:yes gene_type:complete